MWDSFQAWCEGAGKSAPFVLSTHVDHPKLVGDSLLTAAPAYDT
jgi:hypothetical protein